MEYLPHNTYLTTLHYEHVPESAYTRIFGYLSCWLY